MKLYATVTSERASKGQGGNDLHIEITDQKRQAVAYIQVIPQMKQYQGRPYVISIDNHPELVEVFMLQEKAKRKKASTNTENANTTDVAASQNLIAATA